MNGKIIITGIVLLAIIMIAMNRSDIFNDPLLREINYVITILIIILAFAGAKKAVHFSQVRLPLFIIFILSGAVLYITESIYTITLFLFLLGFLTFFESMHPTGYLSMIKPILRFLPRRIRKIVLFTLKFILIGLGIFIMFIGIISLSFI